MFLYRIASKNVIACNINIVNVNSHDSELETNLLDEKIVIVL